MSELQASWNPTPQAFEAYMKREVELARINLLHNRQADTLHSKYTAYLVRKSS